jgi:hypothetical protein
MGSNNSKAKSEQLPINKKIEVIINTNKNGSKLNKTHKNKIKKYVKTVLALGSSFNDNVSKYMKITKTEIKVKKNKIQINILLKISKNKNNFTKDDLAVHITNAFNIWSQNDPLQLNKKTEFTISRKEIKNIIINI